MPPLPADFFKILNDFRQIFRPSEAAAAGRGRQHRRERVRHVRDEAVATGNHVRNDEVDEKSGGRTSDGGNDGNVR
jgi:hypothetical protein